MTIGYDAAPCMYVLTFIQGRCASDAFEGHAFAFMVWLFVGQSNYGVVFSFYFRPFLLCLAVTYIYLVTFQSEWLLSVHIQ